MLGPVQFLLEDKRAAIEYDVEVDPTRGVRPGSTYPNCQVNWCGRGFCGKMRGRSTLNLRAPPLNLHTQWHVKFSFNYTSQGLIDPNAVYYAELLAGPRSGLAYKIKGRFPPAIYFSWQVGKLEIPYVSRWLDFCCRIDRGVVDCVGGYASTDWFYIISRRL